MRLGHRLEDWAASAGRVALWASRAAVWAVGLLVAAVLGAGLVVLVGPPLILAELLARGRRSGA